MAASLFSDLVDGATNWRLRDTMWQETDSISNAPNETVLQNFKMIEVESRRGWPRSLDGPTTAVSYEYSTDLEMSIVHPVAATGDIYVGGISHAGVTDAGTYNTSAGMLIDMLGAQGGLDASLTSLQTTNLPTATLPTRGGNGEGVWMALQGTDAWGSTNSVLTVTYTNQAGTGGQEAELELAGTVQEGAFYIIPMANGDTGVRSIESCQLSAAPAGNFGFVLFRPILHTAVRAQYGNTDFTTIPGWNTPIDDEAVLVWMWDIYTGSSNNQNSLAFSFFEV